MSRAPAHYRLFVRLARAAAPLIALAGPKPARGVAGRRRAVESLVSWGAHVRDPARPTAWFHVPSVGEGLQAGAVVRALRGRAPNLQVVLTHFSPSAEGLGERIGADAAAYLPWDAEKPMARTLDALRPDLLVFTRTEVWPVLVAEAARRGVPTAMVAGTVPPGSGRLRPTARLLLGRTWSSLTVACACTEEDGAALSRLGVRDEALHVTGDPAVDAAAERVDAVVREGRGAGAPPAHLAPFERDARPTVVAGSTWPADEAVLLPALGRLRRSLRRLRVVIAPHEPDPPRVRDLLEQLGRYGWSAATLSEVECSGTLDGRDAVVVDGVGRLADLYLVGTAAYVGGGFHRAGLHSVLEPAAAGSPVVFGPRHERSRAASALLRAGGAKVAADADALARALGGWLEDPIARVDSGDRVRGYIEDHRGAAERTARVLAAILESKRPA